MYDESNCGAFWILDILRALWDVFDQSDPLES